MVEVLGELLAVNDVLSLAPTSSTSSLPHSLLLLAQLCDTLTGTLDLKSSSSTTSTSSSSSSSFHVKETQLLMQALELCQQMQQVPLFRALTKFTESNNNNNNNSKRQLDNNLSFLRKLIPSFHRFLHDLQQVITILQQQQQQQQWTAIEMENRLLLLCNAGLSLKEQWQELFQCMESQSVASNNNSNNNSNDQSLASLQSSAFLHTNKSNNKNDDDDSDADDDLLVASPKSTKSAATNISQQQQQQQQRKLKLSTSMELQEIRQLKQQQQQQQQQQEKEEMQLKKLRLFVASRLLTCLDRSLFNNNNNNNNEKAAAAVVAVRFRHWREVTKAATTTLRHRYYPLLSR